MMEGVEEAHYDSGITKELIADKNESYCQLRYENVATTLRKCGEWRVV
jgi:hypothetical protein